MSDYLDAFLKTVVVVLLVCIAIGLGYRLGYDKAHGELYGPVVAEIFNKSMSGGIHLGDEFIKCEVVD